MKYDLSHLIMELRKINSAVSTARNLVEELSYDVTHGVYASNANFVDENLHAIMVEFSLYDSLENQLYSLESVESDLDDDLEELTLRAVKL